MITEENAADFLRKRGWVDADERVQVERLCGGVSNEVFRVRCGQSSFVLKQARERLRVADEWKCAVERIWRERDVMKTCGLLLGPVASEPDGIAISTPSVLFEDAENYAIGITAAAPDQLNWKDTLLRGEPSVPIATACGRLLGSLHAGAWHDERVRSELADRTYFIELRVDPYYRHVGRQLPNCRSALVALEKSLDENRCTLVHGDYSPKNLLVSDTAIMLIDFEVGHFGDPAFDIGFFLSHLALKCCWSRARLTAAESERYFEMLVAFWSTYQSYLEPVADWPSLSRRAFANFAGCGWARIDGKSKVDYLPKEQTPRIRELLQRWLIHGMDETHSPAELICDRIQALNRQ